MLQLTKLNKKHFFNEESYGEKERKRKFALSFIVIEKPDY